MEQIKKPTTSEGLGNRTFRVKEPAVKRLRTLQQFQQQRPHDLKGKKRTQKSQYGALSNTSRYRIDKVAERTLTTSTMSAEQQWNMLNEAAAVPPMERVRKDKLAPSPQSIRANGRIIT